MKWITLHIRRDNDSVLHYLERPIIQHLADELNKIEKEQGEIVYFNRIDDSEEHIQAVIKIKEHEDGNFS